METTKLSADCYHVRREAGGQVIYILLRWKSRFKGVSWTVLIQRNENCRHTKRDFLNLDACRVWVKEMYGDEFTIPMKGTITC